MIKFLILALMISSIIIVGKVARNALFEVQCIFEESIRNKIEQRRP